MQKIISVFQRNYDGDRLIRDEVVPGAEWVLAGEGIATRKWDGTSCLVRDGALFKRYDAKHGKTPPAGFVPAQEPDPVTGHWPGWLAVGDGPEDRWHREAWERGHGIAEGAGTYGRVVSLADGGTYELCGPKVQGNPDGFAGHVLVEHGGALLPDCPRDFAALREYLRTANIEGVVFWHPDGRMAKVKTRDFGLKRGAVLASPLPSPSDADA